MLASFRSRYRIEIITGLRQHLNISTLLLSATIMKKVLLICWEIILGLERRPEYCIDDENVVINGKSKTGEAVLKKKYLFS